MKKAGVICSRCGALRTDAPDCKRCKGTGRVPVDDALLKELRTRVICVSGAEVEALLNEIDKVGRECVEARVALLELFRAFVQVCETSTGHFTESQVEAVKQVKAVLGI